MIDQNIKKRLGALADRTVQQMRNYLKRAGKFNTGTLHNSISWRFVADGIEITVGANYADFVIKGRRAGAKQPPRQAILKWLNTPNGSRVYFNMKRRWKTITKEQASFLIGRGIKRRGIKPLDFYNPPMNRLLNIDLYHQLSEDYAYQYEHEIVKTLKKGI